MRIFKTEPFLAVLLQYNGKVTYNGRDFNEFLPQTASVYIEQV
jgi:hypothetical protein